MRRRRAVKRELVPDVKYNSELVARLINTIMTRGKKSTAQNIVYGALDVIQSKKPDMPAIDVFMQALENVKPKLEVKSRRVGGATYQVPIEVDPERQVADHHLFAQPQGQVDDRIAGRRAARCVRQHRFFDQEERRYLQNGAGEQGVRSLPLVINRGREYYGHPG